MGFTNSLSLQYMCIVRFEDNFRVDLLLSLGGKGRQIRALWSHLFLGNYLDGKGP